MFQRNDSAIRALRLLFRQRRTAYFLMGLIFCAAALDIAVPFITQRLIDAVVKLLGSRADMTAALPILLYSAIGILIATVSTRALRSLYNYRLFCTVTKLEDETKCRAMENYIRLHALYHRDSNSGQIMGRIDRGAVAFYGTLFDIFGQSLIPPLVIFSGVFIALFLKNPWIAITVCLPLPIYLFTIRRLTGKIYDAEVAVSENFEEVAKETYDVASNVMTVKKFSREREEVDLQRYLLAKARATQYRAERIWTIIENAQTVIAALARIIVIVLGGFLTLTGRSTVGEFVLFVTLQEMAYGPMSQLSIIFPRLRRNVSRLDRLFAIIDEEPEIKDKPGASDLQPLRYEIEFRDVWFHYGQGSRWALKNINLRVPAGATVALVGRSGSGKTTFINLLLRMFEPQSGNIMIDGVDIRDVTQRSLHDQIAVVPQEVDLFSRTVAENIAYGKPGASMEEIEAAARSALAHGFIRQSDHGYETIVGERGLKLSGGERQRIGIARAILRDPRILILDEATSHLDTESEQLIQQATEHVVRDRAAFIIAHRLSTILHADMIVVFNEGAIEAVGTHEELLASSSTYRKLHELHEGRHAPAIVDDFEGMAAVRAMAANGD